MARSGGRWSQAAEAQVQNDKKGGQLVALLYQGLMKIGVLS